jgi:hypothetical protein
MMVMMAPAVMVAQVAVMMVMHGMRRRGGVGGHSGEADDQGGRGENVLQHD